MAVVNRTVDKIRDLEAKKHSAKTFADYLNLADAVFYLKQAFLAELAQVRQLAPPTALS